MSLVVMGVAWACDRPPTSPSTPPPPSPSPPVANTFVLSGVVTDLAGMPVAGAVVEVDYKGGQVTITNPPSRCPFSFCWTALLTNPAGEYSFQFTPGPPAGRGSSYVYSFHDGYESNIQWLPTHAAAVTLNFNLRKTAPIPAGRSTMVSVDGESSLCTDLEDNWALTHRCEIVAVEAGAGTLIVRAQTAAGTFADMFWYTTGNYAGGVRRSGPGTVTMPTRGGIYRLLVGMPDGSPAQQFVVSTELQ